MKTEKKNDVIIKMKINSQYCIKALMLFAIGIACSMILNSEATNKLGYVALLVGAIIAAAWYWRQQGR